MVQPLQQALVHKAVEEVHFLGSVLQDIGNDILNHILGQAHIVRQVSEGNLRLDHPELGGMPGGVGIFGTEGGAKGVDVLESHGEGFAVELTGNSQIGGLTVEVLGEIHLAVLSLGDVVQVEGGDLEHFAGAFAVRTGNQGRVDIHKVPILEELMDGHGSQAPHAENSLEGVGAGTQMGNSAQELHGVTLGLQGEVTGGGAFYLDGGSLNFKGLLGVGSQNHLAGNHQGCTDVDFGDLLEVFQGVIVNHLNRGEVGTIIEHDEAELLRRPTVSYPTSDLHFLVSIFACVFEQFSNRNQFHSRGLLSCKSKSYIV